MHYFHTRVPKTPFEQNAEHVGQQYHTLFRCWEHILRQHRYNYFIAIQKKKNGQNNHKKLLIVFSLKRFRCPNISNEETTNLAYF